MNPRRLFAIWLLVVCSQGDSAPVFSGDPLKEELFTKIRACRETWRRGYVHCELSGHIGFGERTEVRAWWDKDRARIENHTRGLRTYVRTPDSSRMSSDILVQKGIPFIEAREHRHFDEHFCMLPCESWLTTGGRRDKPIERWLEQRPNPVYVATDEGYTVVIAPDDARKAAVLAVRNGQSLKQALPTNWCMTVVFSADGRPLRLKYFGELPRVTIRVTWTWGTDDDRILSQLVKEMSTDHGQSYGLVSRIKVLDHSKQLPEDVRLFELP